ncbi:hypothetical protein LZG00_18665 [Rhodobacteraceae bacterium LMO-12]|nr:hypothetical protein [Rhodobacteraceae bacterium LMO-JJ12]
MKHIISAFLAGFLVVGCAQLSPQNQMDTPESGQVRPMARPEGGAAMRPPASARTVDQFDTTSAAEKTAAKKAAEESQKSGKGKLLGRTVASLGDPTDPGIWIKTPLVSTPSKGRVVYPANGKAVQLDLIPIEGEATGGSRMSLAALRAIEAPLTDLPEVEVYSE